jgi:hypothetical protein
MLNEVHENWVYQQLGARKLVAHQPTSTGQYEFFEDCG